MSCEQRTETKNGVNILRKLTDVKAFCNFPDLATKNRLSGLKVLVTLSKLMDYDMSKLNPVFPDEG